MALTTESKVGLFFLIALAILGVITFKVENLGALMHRTDTYSVEFNHAANLKIGDTVAMAGVKIGEVKAIQLKENGVLFVLAVERGVHIHKDAVATIAWGGLLGSRFIDITLGTPESAYLEPGSQITNTAPTVEISEVLKKLDAAASSLQDMLKGSNFGPKLTALLDNMDKITNDISQQKGTIGKLIGSDDVYQKAVAIADDLKDTSERINKIVKDNDTRISSIIENLDAAGPEIKDAFAAIKKFGDQVNTGKGLLPGLLNDEQMYKDFKDSLAQLRTSMDKIQTVAANMQEGKGLIGKLSNDQQLADDFGEAVHSVRIIAERIEKGEGTLGKLTKDDQLYLEAKKVLEDARETLRSAREQVPVGTFAGVLLSVF